MKVALEIPVTLYLMEFAAVELVLDEDLLVGLVSHHVDVHRWDTMEGETLEGKLEKGNKVRQHGNMDMGVDIQARDNRDEHTVVSVALILQQ